MTLSRIGVLASALGVVLCALGGCAGHAAESDRPWVRRLVLHGVRHVDEKDLRRHLITEETQRLLWAKKRPFDPFALAIDVKRIEGYYRAHGFFDARVRSTDVNPADRAHAVNVEINIDEGPATKIDQLTTRGLDLIGDDAVPVASNFDLRRGQIFDHTRYLSEKQEMAGRLQSLGYPWATVDGDVVVDRDRRVANVTLDAKPGPKARIRNLDVDGAYIVDRRLILRHALLRPGMLLTSDAVATARTKLYNLGFLSAVRVTHQPNLRLPDQADVTVHVTEAPFNEWRLGVGLTLELARSEIRGRAEYIRHYVGGGLRRLRIRAEPAYVFLPALWDPLRQGPAATLEAELTQLDVGLPPDEIRAAVAYDLGVEYAFQYHGPRAQVGYARNFFHDRLQLGASYSFQYSLFFEVDPALLVDKTRSAEVYGFIEPYRLGWLEESVVLDLRDQPLDTRKGGWFSVRAEEGGIWSGGAMDYEKLTIEARGYYPLWGRLVIAARTLFGQGFSHGGTGSPITRRFYLGGPESHRGFNYNRLSLQIPSGIAGNPSLPIGGDQMFLTQLELRVRAVRLFGSWLEVAGFLDAGDVAAPSGQPHDSIDLGELHLAVGGGLRYHTAIGTIRVDVGVRVNRLESAEPDGRMNPDAHQPVAFHLSIGEPF
jgi:outer membrane protein assembly factor BamA